MTRINWKQISLELLALAILVVWVASEEEYSSFVRLHMANFLNFVGIGDSKGFLIVTIAFSLALASIYKKDRFPYGGVFRVEGAQKKGP